MLKPQDQTNSRLSSSKSGWSSHPSLSTLNKSKGFLVENPDGTLIQIRPFANPKINEETNINANNNNNVPINNNNSGLLPIFPEEDFAFFPANQEIPEFVDELIGLFLKHSKFFYTILFIQMALDITFNILTYCYKSETLREMSRIYEEMYERDLKIIFWSFFLINVLFGIFYYPLGFFSLWRRSIKLLNWFTGMSLAGLLAEMLLAYINKFNLIIFFLRILSYVYGKFLMQLIFSMLILPR